MASLKELLDLAYELEALVTLAQVREGVPPRLHELIAAKAAAIGAAAGVDCGVVAQITAPEDCDADSYSLEEAEAAPEPPLAEEIVPPVVEEIIENTNMAEGKTVQVEMAEDKAGETLRRRFSLNDKFRFRRELFAGSDSDFSEALNAIAASDNLSDAEDFLYSQLRLDPDDDAVKAFVEVISGYFS